jgi:hypothetical protein
MTRVVAYINSASCSGLAAPMLAPITNSDEIENRSCKVIKDTIEYEGGADSPAFNRGGPPLVIVDTLASSPPAD